jgi:hypothetical protein
MPETIRLHNKSGMNLSIHLALVAPKIAPRLRRGVSLLPINIPAGQYYDMCRQLDIDIDEARQIVKNSPEVQRKVNQQLLLVREFPPPPEERAQDAARAAKTREAQAKVAALKPAESPDAVPVGVDLELAGLPPETPRLRRHPDVVKAEREAAAKEATALIEVEDTPVNEAAVQPLTTTAAPEAPVVPRDPSMDWSIDALQAFAAEKGIDLGSASSKTTILKRIRKALTE